MRTREHYELFRHLMKEHCLLEEEITFVENVAKWCAENGIPEPDTRKPIKLVKSGRGCGLLVGEEVPEDVIEERIRALRVRGALLNVAFDRTEKLDSEKKKLAYLFLYEYAMTVPSVAGDDLLADNWAFDAMDSMGFFK